MRKGVGVPEKRGMEMQNKVTRVSDRRSRQ